MSYVCSRCVYQWIHTMPEPEPPWRLCTLMLALGWALTFSCLTANASAGNLAVKTLVPDLTHLHSTVLACSTFANGLMNLALPHIFGRLGQWKAYILGTLLGLMGELPVLRRLSVGAKPAALAPWGHSSWLWSVLWRLIIVLACYCWASPKRTLR